MLDIDLFSLICRVRVSTRYFGRDRDIIRYSAYTTFILSGSGEWFASIDFAFTLTWASRRIDIGFAFILTSASQNNTDIGFAFFLTYASHYIDIGFAFILTAASHSF